MKFWLFTALLLVAPGLASAAGFAKGSMFLSKTPVTEGETVLIHAVIANESTAKFTGDVVFKDGESKIGSVAVSIAGGGANTVSVSWKPSAGSHRVTAELTGAEGVVESESATFTINEKPSPASAGGAGSSEVGSSADIQQKISELSPAVGSASAPVFSVLDSARAQAAHLLDTGIDWAKNKSGGKKPGEILGSATATQDQGGVLATVWLVLATILFYILSILRFVVGNAGIFYPAFAILFFYILWRLYKRMRRPQFPVYE